MKLSQSSIRTQKNIPADEVSLNAKLLIRAGYIYKDLAGVYTQLPLAYKVLQNIIQVIREEMNNVGGEEMLMPTLQNPEIWKKTNRWIDNKDVDAWFTTQLKDGTELGLGFTHEENITNVFSHIINSYKDMPLIAYQFQNKFRNETRAKSGVMRTREFIMKDAYTFCKDEDEHNIIYERIKNAYIKIFNRLGIGDRTFITFASGGVFSKYSHEFQTICDSGEDDIYIDRAKNIAINKEVMIDEVLNDLGVKREELEMVKASEVGNIFSLGTKFSSALNLKYKNESGEEVSVVMGSYGIGPARVMGVIAELLADDNGLIWPNEIAPYQLHLISLSRDKNDNVYKKSEEIYNKLRDSNVEVLWDDRLDIGAGEKFADSDLIGIPMRVLVSDKSLANNQVEIKERKSGKIELLETEVFLNSWTKNCE